MGGIFLALGEVGGMLTWCDGGAVGFGVLGLRVGFMVVGPLFVGAGVAGTVVGLLGTGANDGLEDTP